MVISTNVLALERSENAISNIGFSEPKEIINITSRINGYLKEWNFNKGDSINIDDLILVRGVSHELAQNILQELNK